MKTISATDVDDAGSALVVRYTRNDAEPHMLTVGITSQAMEGGPFSVARCEVVVISTEQEMTFAQLHAKLEAEGQARRIGNVAWIDET